MAAVYYPTQAQVDAFSQYGFLSPVDAAGKYLLTKVSNFQCNLGTSDLQTQLPAKISEMMTDDPDRDLIIRGCRAQIETSVTASTNDGVYYVVVVIHFFVITYQKPFTQEDYDAMP